MGKTIPVCCGVDVHKKFLIATILTGDYLIPQCKQKHFGTSYSTLSAIILLVFASFFAFVSTL